MGLLNQRSFERGSLLKPGATVMKRTNSDRTSDVSIPSERGSSCSVHAEPRPGSVGDVTAQKTRDVAEKGPLAKSTRYTRQTQHGQELRNVLSAFVEQHEK